MTMMDVKFCPPTITRAEIIILVVEFLVYILACLPLLHIAFSVFLNVLMLLMHVSED